MLSMSQFASADDFHWAVREENKKLRAALEELLWYVGQLEPLVYSANDTDDHDAVAKARAALSN